MRSWVAHRAPSLLAASLLAPHSSPPLSPPSLPRTRVVCVASLWPSHQLTMHLLARAREDSQLQILAREAAALHTSAVAAAQRGAALMGQAQRVDFDRAVLSSRLERLRGAAVAAETTRDASAAEAARAEESSRATSDLARADAAEFERLSKQAWTGLRGSGHGWFVGGKRERRLHGSRTVSAFGGWTGCTRRVRVGRRRGAKGGPHRRAGT